VNSKNGWLELLPHLKLPGHCVNGSVALKQIYLRRARRGILDLAAVIIASAGGSSPRGRSADKDRSA
ncbi:hypothetical protein NQ318_013404, partial [Aromia moschata]